METEKKTIVVSRDQHKQLKKRAVERETTIENEISQILEREFNS